MNKLDELKQVIQELPESPVKERLLKKLEELKDEDEVGFSGW